MKPSSHQRVLSACLAAAVLAATAAVSALVGAAEQGGTGGLVLAIIAVATAVPACVLAAVAWWGAVVAERRRNEATRENQAQARVLSHEIRTPLAIIQGSAELLAEPGVALSPEQQGFLRAIISNTRTLQRLVEDLLTQARIDAGLFSMRPELVDFRELIAELVDELRPLYQVKILLGNLRAPLMVSLDPVLLRQVLNNLVSNCARYSSGSRVLIRVIQQESGVLTVVSDFGPGLDRSPGVEETRHPDSNGIGLRVVRSIMRLHGGALFLDSTPGHGTTASFYLPSAPERGEP